MQPHTLQASSAGSAHGSGSGFGSGSGSGSAGDLALVLYLSPGWQGGRGSAGRGAGGGGGGGAAAGGRPVLPEDAQHLLVGRAVHTALPLLPLFLLHFYLDVAVLVLYT